jgi:3-dehydroquinate dehydratase type I
MVTFCTSITAFSVAETIDLIKKVPHRIDRIEIRADYIRDLDCSGIEKIATSIKKESIFTCRCKKEGGMFAGSEEERIAFLRRAAGLFTYIDVEWETIGTFDFDKKTSQFIISYHNTADTPHYWQLQKIIFDMKRYEPDVIKIACFVKEPYDSTKLYRLMINKPHEERRVIIGMGKFGKMTRILGPLLGDDMTFVTTVCPASAPGQYTLEEMTKIYKLI